MKHRGGTLLALILAVGALLGTAATLALQLERKPSAVVTLPAADDADDEDELLAANANLVASLQECNRRLGQLESQKGEALVPSALAARARARPLGSARADQRRGAPSREDWEQLAKAGVVPYRVPCVRDTPFKPSPRMVDRLGLAPGDVEAVSAAYASSNQRMASQVQPICARVVGSPEIAARIGPSACMKAVIDGARREDPEKMREALVRVAEVNAGKRAAPGGPDAQPLEALLLALTSEGRAFQSDLAARIGPDDAERIASARGMCVEGGNVSASPDGEARSAGRRAGAPSPEP